MNAFPAPPATAPAFSTTNPQKMKTETSLLLLAGLFAGAASLAFASPPNWETLRKESQFKELKPGDKIVYVCNQGQTVTEKTIGNTAEAMEYCKADTTVMCPSCKTTVKLVTQGAPKNQTTSRKVKFVNDKGEECFFIAKVVEAK